MDGFYQNNKQMSSFGGDDRNRTGVRGFADLCLTTRPRRHAQNYITVAEKCLAWQIKRARLLLHCMKNITRNTEVISVSLPKEMVIKLEKARETKKVSRSALVASLIDKEAEELLWEKIYRKGRSAARKLNITSEDDIDRILHAP